MATYRDAGVNLDAAEQIVGRIAPAVKQTWTADVVGGFGGFAGGIALPNEYQNPVLMLSTDGVGTKAEVARRTGMVDGLGWDLVAMCADDLSATGAKPIALTDYIAIGTLDMNLIERLVGSISRACVEANIVLLGGETAEHPGVLARDQFDLSATALGLVERNKVVDGSGITPGDCIIGLPSPNLRSNGFSLLRKTLLSRLDPADPYPGSSQTVAEALMAPSIVYSPAVHNLLGQIQPHGMAHITGGGIASNIERILPSGTAAEIDSKTWITPETFQGLYEATGANESELYRTFNMGIGYVIVVDGGDLDQAVSLLIAAGHDAREIGRIVPGQGKTEIIGIR